ncbi:MAG: serine hydrolase domain-containing protein [Bacteroidota bacterium]
MIYRKFITKTLVTGMLVFYSIPTNGQQQQQLDHYLEAVYKQHIVPGFSVVVVDKNGPIYQKGFGKKRLDLPAPFTKNTVSAIGSLTKSMTAMAVMQLVEQGDLELDAPVVKYLPQFRTANSEKSDKVTVRMLLNNTSGLQARPQPTYDVSDATLEKLVQDLKSTFIIHEPGTVYEYSNLGFSVAGYLIREVSGLSYKDFLEQRIFGPLGMKNTSTDPERFKEMGAIEGHYHGITEAYPALREKQFESGEYIPAGSFTCSTAQDLGNYLMALLNQGKLGNVQVLSNESITQMWTPNSSFPGLSLEEGGDDTPIAYGLGWMLSNIEGRKIIHHGGSTGKMSSMTMIDPTNSIAVTILANLDLTFIDQYQYPTIFTLANNILHLATGNAISEFGKPIIADPTLNDFHLDTAEMKRYTGEFVQVSGGDFWVYFGLTLHIKYRESKPLEAIVTRGGNTINHFELDFVTPSLAMGRNMGIPPGFRFKLSPEGEVMGLFANGVEYVRTNKKRTEYYRRVALKGVASFLLPKHWKLQELPDGLFGTDPDNSDTRIRLYVHSSPIKMEHPMKNGDHVPPVAYQSCWFSERVGQYVWKHQSRVGSGNEKEICTTFMSEMEHMPFYLEITSSSEKHTRVLQQVASTVLHSLALY